MKKFIINNIYLIFGLLALSIPLIFWMAYIISGSPILLFSFVAIIVIWFIATSFVPAYISKKIYEYGIREACKCESPNNCDCLDAKIYDLRYYYKWQDYDDERSSIKHWSGEAEVLQLEDNSWKWKIAKPIHFEIVDKGDWYGIVATKDKAQFAAEKFLVGRQNELCATI